MNKKKFSCFLIFLSVIMSLFLFGCKTQKIEFYRESEASKLFKKPQQEKIQKSSGMIIYRAGQEETRNVDIQFGPKNIEFDLPSKF